ncbi:MAG: tyrosine-type recombinase/integrase [Chloroflexota bacterium]
MKRQVRSFLEEMEVRRGCSVRTRQAYAGDLRRWLTFLRQQLGREPEVTDFTRDLVRKFLEAEIRAGRRRTTLLRRVSALRRLADYLMEQGVAVARLEQDEGIVKVVDNAPPQSPTDCLNTEQLESVWKKLRADRRPIACRDQAIFALILQTGVSVRNLVELNITDIDLYTRRIALQRGKGKAWFPIGATYEVIKRYLEVGRPELIKNVHETALFISQMGGGMTRQGVWQILRRWGREADLPFRLTPRVLRHTAALCFYQEGRSLIELQALLGHTNPLSTQALIRRLRASCGGVKVSLQLGE